MNPTLTHCFFRGHNLKEEREACQDTMSVKGGSSRQAVMEGQCKLVWAQSTA